MSPRKRVFFSFLLNKSLSKDQIRPEHLLHNTISPCAQTRRIKDIGQVLREYYGVCRAIASNRRIRQNIKMDTLQWNRCIHGERREMVPLTEQFTRLTDPRVDRTKRHKLIDVVAIAICAVICGADSLVDVELFGKLKRKWPRVFLALPNGCRRTTPLVESSPSWTRSSSSGAS